MISMDARKAFDTNEYDRSFDTLRHNEISESYVHLLHILYPGNAEALTRVMYLRYKEELNKANH